MSKNRGQSLARRMKRFNEFKMTSNQAAKLAQKKWRGRSN